MFFILRILWSESAADHLSLTRFQHFLWDGCGKIKEMNLEGSRKIHLLEDTLDLEHQAEERMSALLEFVA